VAQKILNQLLRYFRYKRKTILSRAVSLYLPFRTLLMRLSNKSGNQKIPGQSVQIILDPVHQGWILEKIAKKIVDYWPETNQPNIFNLPKTRFALTHWMHYMNVPPKYLKYSKGIHTVQVTHVDTQLKLNHLEKLVKLGAIPIFMSQQHSEQVSELSNDKFESYVILPGSDVALFSNRIRILISSNFYPDGRKNENFLINLAKEVRLDGFHFTIIGKSWGRVARFLIEAGAQVKLFSPQDLDYPSYEAQLGILKGVDCYLYLGFDEGSLGSLDAYLSGTPMIISKQGFHLEFKSRPDLVLFENFAEFKEAFTRISPRNQISPSELSKWSWYSFSSSYEQLWNQLIHKRRNS
jgi:hypothetical protein